MERRKLVIPQDIAEELRYESVDSEYNFDTDKVVPLEKPYEEVEREHLGSARWEQTYKIVFEHDGAFWAWKYQVASTEIQEDRDLLDASLRTATEVFPEQQTVTVYR